MRPGQTDGKMTLSYHAEDEWPKQPTMAASGSVPSDRSENAVSSPCCSSATPCPNYRHDTEVSLRGVVIVLLQHRFRNTALFLLVIH